MLFFTKDLLRVFKNHHCIAVPSEWTHNTVREAVLQLLREISQSKLSKLCQISQPLLSSIVNNKYEGKIGKRKCEEFAKWYIQYRESHPIVVCGNKGQQKDKTTEEMSEEKDNDKESERNVCQTSQSCETRLTFHSSAEVPQLRQWFKSNPKPSDHCLQRYADILNENPLRQERTQVTIKSLKNWWKNERQRERNLLKRKAKEKSKKCETSVDTIGANQLLLSCSTSADIGLNESRDSSEDEPTLTITFTDDIEDNIL